MMGNFSTMLVSISSSYSMYSFTQPTMRAASAILRNPTANAPQYLNCMCTRSMVTIQRANHIVCLYGVYIVGSYVQECGKITGTSVGCMLRMNLKQ